MKNMLRIGDFSKFCQVSIKALRHWDEIDLLKPAYVDPTSHYRYYDIQQLYRVNRILALRAMGLSLGVIHELLSQDVSAEEIRGMFRLKRAEIQQEIEDAQFRLQLLEARLNFIEEVGHTDLHDVVLKPIPAQKIVARRDVFTDTSSLSSTLTRTFDAVRERPMIAIFHDHHFDHSDLDVEYGFFTEKVSEDGFAPRVLPAVQLMATTIHRGSWIKLSEGYNALGCWITQHGYRIVGTGREVFHNMGSHTPDDEYVTEMQFPVEKI